MSNDYSNICITSLKNETGGASSGMTPFLDESSEAGVNSLKQKNIGETQRLTNVKHKL